MQGDALYFFAQKPVYTRTNSPERKAMFGIKKTDMEDQKEVNGIIKKIIFYDPSSGRAAYLVEPRRCKITKECRKGSLFKVYGNCTFETIGQPASFSGKWKSDDEGWEFCFASFDTFPVSRSDTEEYLMAVTTLPMTDIRKVAKNTSDIFSEVLPENAAALIASTAGISQTKAGTIVKTVREIVYAKDCYKMIAPYKGTVKQAKNIVTSFPFNPIAEIKKNPYRVAAKARIQFEIADEIAKQLGMRQESEERIDALCREAVLSSERAGNACATINDLCRMVNKYTKRREPLSVPSVASVFERTNAKAQNDPAVVTHVIRDEKNYDLYYTDYMLAAEKGLAKNIARLQASGVELPRHPEYIKKIEGEFHISYGKNQLEAFNLLGSTGVKILTGGPGTGKTTTLNGMLRYLEMCADEADKVKKCHLSLKDMSLAALSGKAAQRMTESTKREASTVHKLLKTQPYDGGVCEVNASNPLPSGVIVIDETSMLDMQMCCKLLDAVKNGALVLFVGDIDQLQSIGPGAVLHDMINSDRIEVCRLTEVRRQSKGSSIPWNAHKVISGDPGVHQFGDFKIKTVKAGEGRQNAINAVKALLTMPGVTPEDIQILSATRKGKCGTFIINNTVQPILNPNADSGKIEPVQYRGKNFYPGDRVMMETNNYALGYFNGNIGHIVSVSQSEMVVNIDGTDINIPRDLFPDVSLSYACTVHKSQGSEYPFVVIVLEKEFSFMLDRSLLYTGITRAKRGVIIISEEGALNSAIRKKSVGTRKTMLAERIRECIRE